MNRRLRSSFLADRGERLFGHSKTVTPHDVPAGAEKTAEAGGHTPSAARAPHGEACAAPLVPPPPASGADNFACLPPRPHRQAEPAPAAGIASAGARGFLGVDLAAGDDMTVFSFVVSPQLMVLINALATHDDVSVADALIAACAHRAKAIGLGPLARAVLDEQERAFRHGRHNGARPRRRHENSSAQNSHDGGAAVASLDDLTDVPEFARPNTSRFQTGDR